MATYGNTSASSLLRQADAVYRKQKEYEDSVASYNFYKSDSQPEDFQSYAAYLKDRIEKVRPADPSKALSLQRTLDEAYRRFNSSEISRATLAVNYGAINNRDKYARIMGLYQNAIANGDEALAARLEGNLSSLSITIQNEEDAAARAAAGGGRGGRGGGGGGKAGSVADFDQALKVYDQQLSKGQLTPADYFSKAAKVYQLKEQTLIESANAGSNSAAKDLESLRANDTFQKITSPDVQLKLQRGEQPLAIKRDDAGNLKYDFIKESNVKAVLGPDGKPMRYSDLKDDNGNPLYPGDSRVLTQGTPIIGYTGDSEVQRVRKAGTTPGSPDAIFQYKTLPKQNPTDLNKIFDFTSGRQLVMSNKGEGTNKAGKPADYAYVLGADGNPIPGTDPYGLAAAGGDPTKTEKVAKASAPSLKEFYGPMIEGAIKNPLQTLRSGVNAGANLLTKGLNVFNGRALNDLIAQAQGKQIAVAKAKAEEARKQAEAAAIRKAQEDNARTYAAIQAQAAANRVSAAKRPSILYSPPKPTTIAQSYAVGSQGKSTPTAVARGIGQVVGYNDILKKVGLW